MTENHGKTRKVAILMSVRNEEAYIDGSLKNLMQLTHRIHP